ncbi:hypothetical protein ACP4OV_015853 [Aristida adscensionis]
MEDRVKFILFLLGEEADSFAKRAEMYYKRRPEVIGSVEEAYRAYRALAERYDHISGELHKANHTIATAFPDQVQYAVLDEEDDNLPKAYTTVDPRKIHKSTVEGLMKKKHEGKSGLKDGGKKSATAINKESAKAEISRLQKEILILQTEKEFIKSCYESGIAKYWDLEKQINDMQEEVCYFQEEFNESAVIEDDEARALMTATALKSCEDAIIKMQEQQKASVSQAKIESKRVEVSWEKLKSIMRDYGKSLPYSGNSMHEDVKNEVNVAIDDELYYMKQERIELQEIVENIKEYFQMNSDFSVVQIAEKIDELANKVVDLELMVSAQTAQINRLCLDNNELEKSLQELEEKKIELTCVPGELTDKLKQAEEDLIGVQKVKRSYCADERIVYSNFCETINSFCDISQMLQSHPIEQQDVSNSMGILIDESTTTDSEASDGHRKPNPAEDPEMNEAAMNPQVNGFTDHSGIPEKTILSDDSDDHEFKVENHFNVDKTEDLCCCEIEDMYSCTAASADVGTTDNADNSSSKENNNEEPQHAQETGNTDSSVQQYIVHSHEKDSLEHLHHISPTSPEETVQQEDSMQDYSTPCSSISEGKSEQKMKINKEEDSCITISPTTITSVTVTDVRDQEDHMIKLQQLLMNGLQDKEKVLLAEYTSILRNYKNAKQTLTEMEAKNKECLNEMVAMISDLQYANTMKDAEIQSLRELLTSFTYRDASHNGYRMNSSMSLSEKNGMLRGHRRTPSFMPVHQRAQSVSSVSRIIENSSSLKNIVIIESPKEADASHDVVTDLKGVILEDFKSANVVEMESTPLEEKLRSDIDALLEENLASFMKFSMSFQQIQGFQTKYDQLQYEMGKLINEDKLKPKKDRANNHPTKSEMEATEKRLRELKIELQVWLEQNAMFKGELQCRFDSLCSLQAEIEGAIEMHADTEEGARFNSYEAAKFQGEVSNMKHENNKFSEELQIGLDHVKGLQAEAEKLLAKIVKSTTLSGTKASSTWRTTPSKSRVPLRMFLFPAKKKKPSLLACVHPAFQKQHSDMAFFTKLK